MKQLLQSATTGETAVAEVPAPLLRPGCVLVRTAASLVSAGTERSVVQFARKSMLDKARARPDLVKKVVEKARTDGPLAAWKAARSRLDQPMALGYSSAGVVLEVGEGVEGLRAGDRVACAGGGYASHAEVVCVPRNLVALVPSGVDIEHAAFATVGAIALHGLRLAEPALGETVVVIGLGLIGLMTIQMARAAGCRVVGVDLDAARVARARELGADAAVTNGEDPAGVVAGLTGGHGADAVFVTAGTSSSGPVELAASLARDRGRVVVVGAVGMDLPRPPFYEKELSFRVSRSYGPGRYDPSYEEGGRDYPYGYVRWTQNRNLQAFLDLVARGAVRLDALVTQRIPIAEGRRAYELLTSGEEPVLGMLLKYPWDSDSEGAETKRAETEGAEEAASSGVAKEAPVHPARNARRVDIEDWSGGGPASAGIGVGLLGAGNFATATLLPAMKAAGGLRFQGVAAARGPSAQHVADRFGFTFATTDSGEVLRDDAVDVVAIATRHNLHARQITEALEAGKHVFCEKPPALNEDELACILRALYPRDGVPRALFTVGYNRRFAPMAERLHDFLAPVEEPLAVRYRVNAGYISSEHWVHDAEVGGGRILGEVCHFVDFVSFLTGEVPVSVYARGLTAAAGRYRDDNVVVTLGLSDGSVGSIVYVASGDRAMGKERVEVFGGGRSAVLDDFRALHLFEGGRRRTEKARLEQDKGHRAEWTALRAALEGRRSPPIAVASLMATSLATFAAVRSLHSGAEEGVDVEGFVSAALSGAGS